MKHKRTTRRSTEDISIKSCLSDTLGATGKLRTIIGLSAAAYAAVLFSRILPEFSHLYSMQRLTLKNAAAIRSQIQSMMDTDDPDTQHFIKMAVLLLLTMKDGPGITEIAELFRLAPQTVISWVEKLNEQDARDISQLSAEAHQDPTTLLTATQIEQVDQALKKSPKKLALDKENWTAELLSTYLKDQYGIDLTSTLCQRWMRRMEKENTKPSGR